MLATLALLGVVTVAVWPRDPARVTLSLATAADIRDGVAGRPPWPHPTSVRLIAEVFRDLGLPLPDRISVTLYPSPAQLERGLITLGGLSPARAAEMGRFAVGVSFDGRILLLEPESRRGPRPWLRLLAHEMAHLSQAELAGGPGRGARWLAEGMAEWVAYTVLDRLGVARMTAERARIVRRAGDLLEAAGGCLWLEELGDARGFLDRGQQVGVVPLYHLAFLLADRLIERHGFDALVEYFRAFASGAHPRDSFERAFGQRVEDFEREVVGAPGPAAPCDAGSCVTSRDPVPTPRSRGDRCSV